VVSARRYAIACGDAFFTVEHFEDLRSPGSEQRSSETKGFDLSSSGPPALPMRVDPEVIMQVHGTDSPIRWEAEDATIRLDTATRFQAKVP